MFKDKTILITGGTGTFGNAFIKHLIDFYDFKKIVVFSRDEFKQSEMEKEFNNSKLRFFIGDIRNLERCEYAFKDIDYIVHAAALKHIDKIEYNPFEAVETNILGSMNVIKAAIKNNVKKVIALNTDKSCLPITFYGGTKFLMERLFQTGHVYSSNYQIKLLIVRYGNIMGSRGSVLPHFNKLIKQGKKELPLTHEKMTRFWTSIDTAINLVIDALMYGVGGEIYIPKCMSFRIADMIKAMDCSYKIIGLRSYEKIHEVLISNFEKVYDYKWYYKIYPENNFYNTEEKIKEYECIKKDYGSIVDSFQYDSENNYPYLDVDEIRSLILKI